MDETERVSGLSLLLSAGYLTHQSLGSYHSLEHSLHSTFAPSSDDDHIKSPFLLEELHKDWT